MIVIQEAKTMTLTMSYECYFEAMKRCGFAMHEIEDCWNQPNAFEILDAAELDGERYLVPELH